MLGKDSTSPVFIESMPLSSTMMRWLWRRITYTYADGCKIVLDGENRDKDAALY